MKDESQNNRKAGPEAKAAEGLLDDRENPIDHSRRRLTRAGMAAPVLVTLASRPVFGNPAGGKCLSNIMSGNLSNQNNGNCSLGDGPVSWKQPPVAGNFILGEPSGDAWSLTGYDYGTHDSNLGNGLDCSHYILGTILGDTPLAGLGGGSLNSTPLREILCDSTVLTEIKYCVAALLNARVSAASPSYKYILDVGDVYKLCNGVIPPPPGYATVVLFLKRTFNIGTF